MDSFFEESFDLFLDIAIDREGDIIAIDSLLFRKVISSDDAA